MPSDIFQKLEKLNEETGLSKADIIREALQQYFDEKARQKRADAEIKRAVKELGEKIRGVEERIGLEYETIVARKNAYIVELEDKVIELMQENEDLRELVKKLENELEKTRTELEETKGELERCRRISKELEGKVEFEAVKYIFSKLIKGTTIVLAVLSGLWIVQVILPQLANCIAGAIETLEGAIVHFLGLDDPAVQKIIEVIRNLNKKHNF